MKKKIFFLFSLAAVNLACQKEVTSIKLPESDSKLVVTSFISPQDTAVHVRITRSVPTIGYVQAVGVPVVDAMVRISNDTQTASLEFNDTTGTYFAETAYFPITAGTTYTLRVTTPDGGQAEATCTVPAALDLPLTITLDSASVSYNTQKEYNLRIGWPDPAGETNYYRVAGEVASEYMRPPGNGSAPPQRPTPLLG